MSVRFTCIKNSAILSTGLAAILASPAIAQDTPGSPQAEAEEASNVIIVTAQRVEQDLQDVPVSVTAVAGDDLAARAIDSFDQLQFVAPGVSFVAGTTARQSSTTIRGIGTSAFASGIEGSVAIVVDGVVIGREGAGILDFNDLERVEVLRGPQGTLFGKNASAGVISFVTKNPTDFFTANVSASYGSFNEFNLSGAVSGPVSDGISARLSGFYNTRDGFIDNVNPAAPVAQLNDREEFGVRGKLAFEIGSGDLIIGADYTRRDDNSGALTALSFSDGSPGTGLLGSGVPFLPITLGGSGIVPGVTNDDIASEGAFFAEAEVFGGYAELSLPIGDHDFVSLTAYRGWNSLDNNDADQIPLPFLAINSGDLEQRQFSQEFRVSSPQDGPLRYQGGLFFFYQDIEDRQTQIGTFGTSTLASFISAGAGGLITPEQALAQFILGLPAPAEVPLGVQFGTDLVSETEEFNVAVFGQVEADITDRLTAFAGGRLLYSDISGTADVQVTPGAIAVGFGSVAATPTPLEASVNDFAFVWRGGFNYEIADDASIFATFTRGYKSGGLDSNQAVQETVPGAGDFFTVDPEIPNQFELGLRSRWADGRVTANITGFYTIIEDFQAQTIVPTASGLSIFAVNNAGEVETYGFEAELTVIPTEGLTLSGALAYTNATFDEFDQAPCFTLQAVGPGACIDADGDGAGDFQDLAGADVGQSPDWIANGLVRYDFPDLGGFAPFAQIGIQHRSSTVSGNDNNPATIIGSYELIDFQIGTKLLDDRATLTFFGRNITGADFQASIFATPFDDGGLSQFPTFEAETVFGGRISYEF